MGWKIWFMDINLISIKNFITTSIQIKVMKVKTLSKRFVPYRVHLNESAWREREREAGDGNKAVTLVGTVVWQANETRPPPLLSIITFLQILITSKEGYAIGNFFRSFFLSNYNFIEDPRCVNLPDGPGSQFSTNLDFF